MVEFAHLREEEKEIDFDDTRRIFIDSWETAVELHKIKAADQKVIGPHSTQHQFNRYVRDEQKIAQAQKVLMWRRPYLDGVLQLHRHMTEFENLLLVLVEQDPDDDFMDVQPIDTGALWGLIYLNIKLTVESKIRLKYVWKWLLDLRRNIEKLNGTILLCREKDLIDDNNLRLQLMEIFDPLLEMLRSMIDYSQSHYEDDDFRRKWATFEPSIRDSIDTISDTVRHLRDVMTSSASTMTPQVKWAKDLQKTKSRNDERDVFPVEVLPSIKTEYFIGRENDLRNIHDVLGSESDTSLKTFTIYGRGGVGKTQLALEYIRTQKRCYDAIFWIQCETRAALCQSFQAIAESLELEGAIHNASSSDEVTIRVLRWLRCTERRWLLIYDNAEREQAAELHRYLPDGSQGSVLLTSRSYYNFFEEAHRRGETLQPLSPEEARELLMKQLGYDWINQHLSEEDMMHCIEEKAVDLILEKTRGLPIAIVLAAKQILNEDVDGKQTARGFIEEFHKGLTKSPDKQPIERDEFTKSLDAVRSIAFASLSDIAKTVLSILALIDLSQLSNQRNLVGNLLEFSLSSSSNLAKDGLLTEKIVKPFGALNVALDELEKKGLIARLGRQISLHRTVQEALARPNNEWFVKCFAVAAQFLYDDFPKQNEGRPMNDSWNWCRIWIPHAKQLACCYSQLTSQQQRDGPPLVCLQVQDLVVDLLANCAWYLYEVADYEECLHIISIARSASADDTTITYAHLLNTEGVVYYEQNKLGLAREALERVLLIRRDRFEAESLEMSNVFNNLCNLETAEGNYEKALAFIDETRKITEQIGDSAAVMLALAYMLTGRIYFLQRDYTTAYKTYQKAGALLNKSIARNPYFSASLNYAYGNLALAQDQFDNALREYDEARSIMRLLNPVHPLVAASLYKTALVEWKKGHHTKALTFLGKAQDIADIKSNGKVDGTILRIMWTKSQVMLDDQSVYSTAEGEQLKESCAVGQRIIAEELGIDLSPFESAENEQTSYNALVPGFFR